MLEQIIREVYSSKNDKGEAWVPKRQNRYSRNRLGKMPAGPMQ